MCGMNRVWLSGIALLVLGALLYFMMQSDFMKKQPMTEIVEMSELDSSMEMGYFVEDDEDGEYFSDELGDDEYFEEGGIIMVEDPYFEEVEEVEEIAAPPSSAAR